LAVQAVDAGVEKAYFEDYRPDEIFESGGRTLTEADLVFYSMFSGDWSRRSTDDGRQILPDMFTFSVGLCLLLAVGRNVWIPRTFIAFYGYDEIDFLRGAAVGDTIRSRVTVIELIPRGDDRGIVVYQHETRDQAERLVCSSRHRILLNRRPT
jgi:acyl dehydratase